MHCLCAFQVLLLRLWSETCIVPAVLWNDLTASIHAHDFISVSNSRLMKHRQAELFPSTFFWAHYQYVKCPWVS